MKLIIRQRGEVTDFSPDPSLGIITVGRADTQDIPIKGEKAASREHLTLERTVDGWKLVDQMSSNGTELNGEKVNFAFVKEGDIIQVGTTTIQVTGLDPAPGARQAPARPAGRAGAKVVKPIAPKGEGEPAGPYIPPKKSPVPALVAAAAILLVLAGGGYFLVTNLNTGSTQQDDSTVADRDTDPRKAELSDDEKAALNLATEIKNSSKPTHEKIRELAGLQEKLKGSRGSKALSDITDMKSELTLALDKEVYAEVTTELGAVEEAVELGEYRAAIQRLDDLEEYLASDTYMASFAKAHAIKIKDARRNAEEQNDNFITANYQLMWSFADQFRFDEALEACDDILNRAWLDNKSLDVYETERKKLEALAASRAVKEPVVEDEPAKKGSILDKVKKDEGKLPGKNPLLPDGRDSERELMAAVQSEMVAATKALTLTDDIFVWKGKKAKIKGASDEKLVLEVVHIDKKTKEELVYRTSRKWEDVDPEDMLQLYDRTPDLTLEHKLALVIYCFEHGWMDKAAERALLLYKEKNDWKEGIDILIATKRKITIPTGGFVEYDGALVTPDEKEGAIFYRNLEGVLERFEKGIGHKDRRKAEDAEAAFSELLEMGERAVKPSIEILQGVLDEEMANAKKATGLLGADKERMNALLTELDARREFALELIMDAEKYPYPYGPNQAEVQAEVNTRVASVREIWNDPAKFAGQTNPAFDGIMDKIKAIAQRMAVIDPSHQYYKQTPEETVEYITNIANEDLSIRNYTGDDSGKQKLYNFNVKVMEYNEGFPSGEGHTDGNGRQQVRITNEYRIMFARHALKINDKLFWGAWHHSKYCVEHNGGQIAHVIEGEPRGATPGERMKYEGYSGGGGENIHMNSGGPTPQSSHDSWCNSSGHHRNILHPGWRVLGSGKFKTIWTQKFGAVDEGEGNSVSRGGE